MVTDTDGWLIPSSMVKNGDYGYCGLLVAIDTLFVAFKRYVRTQSCQKRAFVLIKLSMNWESPWFKHQGFPAMWRIHDVDLCGEIWCHPKESRENTATRLFHSELRTASQHRSITVTLMCEPTTLHNRIPPKLLDMWWNLSFRQSLRQGSRFATAPADLPHPSFGQNCQMPICAEIVAKLCHPSFGWSRSQMSMFAKMLVKLRDPSFGWSRSQMSVSAKMLAKLPRSSFG